MKQERSDITGLTVFRLAMIGGSGSGKTTFMSAVCQMLTDDDMVIDTPGGPCVLHLLPVMYDVGGAAEKVGAPVPEPSAPVMPVSAGGGGGAFGAVSRSPAAGRSSSREMHLDALAVEGDARLAVIRRIQAELARRFEIRPSVGGVGSDFREGTDKMVFTEVCFEIYVNDEMMGLMYITDYGGEFIDDPDGSAQEVYNRLIRHIWSSDGAIVLCNTIHMSKALADTWSADTSMFDGTAIRSAVSADGINNMFKALGDKEGFSLVTALTASDSPAVDVRVSDGGYRRAMHDVKKYVLAPSFRAADMRGWSTMLIPVSAVGRMPDGTPNVDATGRVREDARIRPYGVDRAVLFCLAGATMVKRDALTEELESLSRYKLIRTAAEKTRRAAVQSELARMETLIDALRTEKLYADAYEPVFTAEKVAEVGEVKVIGTR
ncbi:MAG: hypothetical protein IKR73_08235 [Oscillospiraceae bacterium]|nr:hypothetical protein [Oscillospiraceae bacterium]